MKDKTHTREWAISELNRFFDSRGVLEEDRIKVSLTKEEKEAMLFMTDEEIAEMKEKSDVDREAVIKAIRTNKLIVEDDGSLKYKLKNPITDKDGNVKLSEVSFKNSHKVKDFKNNMIGIKHHDAVGTIAARVATRIGISRLMVENMDYDDYDYVQSACALFL